MSDKGVTTITLKKINHSKVYQYIYKEKLTPKLQIVRDLQMGLSTVSQNLALLEQEGLIEKNGYFDSTGGRKAHAFQIVSDIKIAIGVGIMKNMFHIVAVNLYGEAVQMATYPIPYENSPEYYRQVTDKIEQFIALNSYDEKRILGVSLATQGIISPDGNSVTYGTILGNADMKLADFSDRLPYTCRLEHDSKAAAYMELWTHDNLDSAIVFLLNPNLGGAVITNHHVHQGISMHSGVIEHLCLNPDGPMCYCGSRGCLETYCSANALEASAGMPIKDFFRVLRENASTPFALLWKDYLNHLAFAMKNLNMVIDSPVIISGYLAPFFIEEDIDYLLEEIRRLSPFSMKKEQILLGTHGQYTPAIGAALFYVDEFIHSI